MSGVTGCQSNAVWSVVADLRQWNTATTTAIATNCRQYHAMTIDFIIYLFTYLLICTSFSGDSSARYDLSGVYMQI